MTLFDKKAATPDTHKIDMLIRNRKRFGDYLKKEDAQSVADALLWANKVQRVFNKNPHLFLPAVEKAREVGWGETAKSELARSRARNLARFLTGRSAFVGQPQFFKLDREAVSRSLKENRTVGEKVLDAIGKMTGQRPAYEKVKSRHL